MMNNLPDSLYSINLEKSVIAGILNFPDVLIDLSNILSDEIFYTREHKILFSVIKGLILNGEKPEKVIVAQKVSLLGLKMDIDILDYLEAICMTTIQKQGIIDVTKELVKLKIRRDLWNNANAVQSYIKESQNDPVDKIISHVDGIYNSQINQYESDDKPCDLFGEAEDVIKERALNPIPIGIQSPFKIFNDMFGGFRPGITAICGRAKNNKSTILLNMGWGAIQTDPNLKVLFLDTELKKYDHIFRAMGAFSQMNPNYLEDGSWNRNSELANKFQKSLDTTNKLKGKLFHHYVGNKSIEEIISIIKRWYFSTCQRGNKGLVIFDYIKVGNEKLTNYMAEHQMLGSKINALNEISHQLNLPILSSMQLNRSAIIDQKEDESAISMTDRLSWFSNAVFIFRKKRPDEINEETLAFGTHKLIPVVTRYQGKNTGLLDLVKITDHHGKHVYKQNFINYNFSNFMLEERGTLNDIVRQNNLQAALQSKKPDNGNMI